MQNAVESAIDTMWSRYREPLSLSEIADVAVLDRLRFARAFRCITGTSPGRFLAAIRLYQAKQLLLETTMSVSDVAYEVGYTSLRTFAPRFTRSVGVGPADYRGQALARLPTPATACARTPGVGGIRGLACAPDTDVPLRIYVGVFDSPIVQGAPLSCDVRDAPGPYRLDRVPDGQWHLRAVAVALDGTAHPVPGLRKPLFVAAPDPVTVRGGRVDVDIDLHEAGSFDLPILLALPELDRGRLKTAAVGPSGGAAGAKARGQRASRRDPRGSRRPA